MYVGYLVKTYECNIFVSYLIRHKNFTTSCMSKYNKIGYPTNMLTYSRLVSSIGWQINSSQSQPKEV
jgi:hypothetical protein